MVKISGRKEREGVVCCRMVSGMGATRRRKRMPALLERLPQARRVGSSCERFGTESVWVGVETREAISLQGASRLASHYHFFSATARA